MKTKFNKESRNLLIGMLVGDGSVSKTNSFRLVHGQHQKEYLQWKINKLKAHGIRNTGLKTSISTNGYSVGNEYYYCRLNIVPFVKTLRRVLYKPYKKIANRKLLNRLDSLGLAIWYLDDGVLNLRKTKDRIHGFYVRISTCTSKEDTQVIIDYFKEVWDIGFYMFKEGRVGKNTYSLCCGTKEGIKFIDLIKEHVLEVPSMQYKISYDLSQRTRGV